MTSKFERSYPQIYHTFYAKDLEEDKTVEYCVQDLPENKFEEAIEFMVENLVQDETFHRALNLYENQSAVSAGKIFYQKVFNDKMSLVCFKTGSDEIISLNAMFVQKKGSYTDRKDIDAKYKILMDAFKFVGEKFDVFDYYQVDKYLTAVGLGVDKKYRRRGIATEMLKAREVLMSKIEDLSVTSTIFTSSGSQKAAEKAGFEENASITLDKIKENFPLMNFSKSDPKTVKICSLKI